MEHWQIVAGGQVTAPSTPEGLWSLAAKYFKWCDDNPVKFNRYIMSGKEAGAKVPIEVVRPYSIKALCIHCGITEAWLRDIRESKNQNSLYYIVVSKILYLVYVQNYEYATVGLFNPIFTAKVLNIGEDDIPNSTVRVEIYNPNKATLSNSESEVLAKLESEKSLFKLSEEQSDKL